MSTERPAGPRLLVSVRSTAEADAAIAGGCDLLDVKEPAAGALGMAGPDVIEAAGRTAARADVPLSVALGELADWPDDRRVPSLPAAVTLAKLGLSGERRRPDWVQRWRAVRDRFDRAGSRSVGWAAVIYADDGAGGPEPAAVLDLAVSTGCRAVLVDTFAKDGRRLLDHVDADRLAAWRDSTVQAGLTFAVAGGLRLGDLPRLSSVRPDVVAVRTAACEGGRLGVVTEAAVRRLKAALKDPSPRGEGQGRGE